MTGHGAITEMVEMVEKGVVKRVAITGLNGFIGQHMIAPLTELGYEIVGIGRSVAATYLAQQVEWYRADLLQPGVPSTVIKAVQPTHLLHLAWYTEHGKFWQSPVNTAWVQASLELLRAFAEQGGRRCVFTGSCAEYDWRYGFLSESLTPLVPSTVFGRSKSALFEAASAFSEVAGMSFASGRIFSLYGPGEAETRLVPHVITSLLRGVPARTSHGAQIRDFMHVSDVARAFAALLDSCAEGPVNIGSGEPVRLRDIIAEIAGMIGRPDLLEVGAIEAQPNDPPCLIADIRRLENEVGFIPTMALQSGLAEVIELCRRSESEAQVE